MFQFILVTLAIHQLHFPMCYFTPLIYFISNTEMDEDLEDKIIGTLKQAIAWAEAREKKLLADVLTLQKRINCAHDTKPVVRKKQLKQTVKQEVKQEDVAVKFGKKIDEMISRAEQQIQQLDNTGKKPKQNTTQKNKFVEPLPQIQKKPPIPTVNRSKDPQLVTHKPNYHYRNKNEVTGKITDTPYGNSKSTTKHSSSNFLKKQQSTNIFQQSSQKAKNVSQKIVNLQSLNSTKNTTKQVRKQVHSMDSKEPKLASEKIVYVEFSTFKTPIYSLIERANEKEKKKTGSRRPALENLLSEFGKNQMGYRQNQNKSVNSFLTAFNKLASSRARLHLTQGLTIQSRSRNAHLETFNFQSLLDNFQSLLNENQVSEEYAPNPKQICKIKCWHRYLNSIFESEIQQTRQSLKLPPTLGINFQMNQKEGQSGDFHEEKEGGFHTNPHTTYLYALLGQQLAFLKELQNFDKESLKKLRVLISIGLYDGKRSPVLIQTQKYEEWKQYYES